MREREVSGMAGTGKRHDGPCRALTGGMRGCERLGGGVTGCLRPGAVDSGARVARWERMVWMMCLIPWIDRPADGGRSREE